LKNIEKLISYLKDNKSKSLIVNEVNEEIGSFYVSVIDYISKDLNLKINVEPKITKVEQNADLFGIEELNIFRKPNTKNIDIILNVDKKNLVFTDYKNFKKYQNLYESINGYNYATDIKFFFNDILKIKNDDIINFCIINPQLTYSEFSKYIINDAGYIKDVSIAEKANFIIDIRKSIFKNKHSQEIKKIFLKIKEEVKYKKFSFLTY
tara:strand:+ start:445 stop:1068 length:624 start_codon:yes stop_codon:yes gene_type:complete